MSVIALPSGFTFVSEDWEHSTPGQRNRSPWTSRSKFVGLPGAEIWSAKLGLESIATEDEEREWRAFLMDLKGQENSFLVHINCQVTPTAAATVGSGATNGYTLPLAGLALSETILKRGDFMSVNLPSGHKRPVVLSANLVSNGSGVATASFHPALGEVPTLGATVTLDKPVCPMRLSEPRVGWSRAQGLTTIMLDAEEAL